MATPGDPNGGSLRHYTRRVWMALGAVTLVVLLLGMVGWLLTGILVLFAALLFGVFLNQLSRRLERWLGIRYGLALGLVSLAIVLGLGATLFFMGSQIVSQVSEYSDQLAAATQRAWERVEATEVYKWMQRQSEQQGSSWLPARVFSTARSALLGTASALGGVAIIAIVGFYLALEPQTYREGLVRLFPVASRPRVDNVLQKVAHTLWAWTLGRLVAMVLIGVGSGVGLWIIGIPLPFTNGVLAGLLNFIPNLGPLMAMTPPALLGLQQGGYAPLYVIGFYLVLQFIEAYLITPLIDQQQVRLPPGLIIAAQLVFGMLGGFLGLMLATPISAVIFVLLREFYVRDVLEAA